MAVKLALNQTAVYSLTSPPAIPDPIPVKAFIAKTAEYLDRKVWVSIPFPDTIELIAPILNDYLSQPDISGKSAKLVYKQLDHDIEGMLKEWALGGDGIVSCLRKKWGTKFEAVFSIQYDPSQPLSRALFTLYRVPGELPEWRAKLKFSPRKAGASGLAIIEKGVDTIASWINFNKLRKAFRIARVDCAIDCIGVEPFDLIARMPKLGKSTVYRGNNGRPQTIYFYAHKACPNAAPKNLDTFKTVGPHRMTLYERTSYEREHGLPLSYGKCPVTRVEIPLRWRKGRPAFAELPALKNPFANVAVAYASGVMKDEGLQKNWRAFCVAAMGAGIRGAAVSVGVSANLAFQKLYRECAGDLVSPDVWSGWKDGLAYTALADWIDAAQ